MSSRGFDVGHKRRRGTFIDSADMGRQKIPYVTIRTLRPHVLKSKPLPPDANKDGSSCTLFQLTEEVEFRCTKCKRDRIHADVVAADETKGQLLCARCFTRLVRPRTYRPTRVIPFPSIVSWLWYHPPKIETVVADNILERPAEAALPSGRRVATEIEAVTSVGQLAPEASSRGRAAAAAMVRAGLLAAEGRIVAGAVGVSDAQQHPHLLAEAAVVVPSKETHPCAATFDAHCVHGALCFFRNAPANLCLLFLMGLCNGDQSKCPKLHEAVFDLPPTPAAPQRFEAADESQLGYRLNPAFAEWVAQRKQSANRAEWQLWHQATDSFINAVLPPPQIESEKLPAAVPSTSAVRDVLTALAARPAVGT